MTMLAIVDMLDEFVEELAKHRLPELDESYVKRIEEDWVKCVKNDAC